MKTITFLNPKKKTMRTKRRRKNPARNSNGRFVKARTNPPRTRRRRARRVRTRAVARRNPTRSIMRKHRRRRRTTAVARRNPSRARRYARRGGRAIKSYLSRDTGMLAASVVGGFMLSNYILNTYGDKLPGLIGENGVNRWVRAAYGVGLPVAAGALTLRFSKQPRIAEGLVVAGLINGINEVVQYFREQQGGAAAPAVEGTSAFLDPGSGMPAPGYQATNAFSAFPGGGSPYESEPAFGGSAWGG